MKLACQEQHIPGATLPEKWDFCREHGFDGIELRGEDGFRFRDRLPELRAAREAGVVMPSVCPATDHFIGDFDEERRRDAVTQMKSLLSVMAEIGRQGSDDPGVLGDVLPQASAVHTATIGRRRPQGARGGARGTRRARRK